MAVTTRPPSPTDTSEEVRAPPPAGSGDQLPDRLARRAVGPHRRAPLLPLPQGSGRHQLVPHARLRDADGVPRPGGDGRDPRDVLQAGSGQRLRVDPAHHERPHARLARPRHAQVGRERLHHPDVLPHGARVPVRRVQVPARAELDHRRDAPRDRDARGLHGLPPAVGPDGVLGDGRWDQPERHGSDPRAVPRRLPARRGRDRRRHARPLLLAAHACRSPA